MQDDIEVADGKITGTLKFIQGGIAASGPLAGDGNFLALEFSDVPEDATSVKVGLDPSQGTGLVELLGDPDMNGVFKITDKDTQVFKIVIETPGGSDTMTFDLSDLTCETGE